MDSQTSMSKNNVSRIVITGGPCAGKTSVLCALRTWAIERNIYPIFIDEISTRLQSSGIRPVNCHIDINDFNRLLLKTQLADEKNYGEIAEKIASNSNKKVILIQDRGILDVAAYIGFAQLQKLLNELGTSLEAEREKYLAAIHLVTAADGAEHAYTTENNTARIETPQQARELDQKTFNAYIAGMPSCKVFRIPNQGDFYRKKLDTINVFNNVLGLPLIGEQQRKYQLSPNEVKRLKGLVSYKEVKTLFIQQIYLRDTDTGALFERRIRKTTDGGRFFYSLTQTRYLKTKDTIKRIKTERMLTDKEYDFLKSKASPRFEEIVKKRECFEINGIYMELDQFNNPMLPYAILEIKTLQDSFTPEIEKIIQLGKDVTDNPKFLNKEIARRN